MNPPISFDVSGEEYQEMFSSAPSSLVDDRLRVPFYDNASFRLSRRMPLLIGIARLPLIDFDYASVGNSPWQPSETITYPSVDPFEKFIGEGIVELDLHGRMPAVRRWKAKITIKNVDRKQPSPMNLDFYEQ
jgi:hypothetical protein